MDRDWKVAKGTSLEDMVAGVIRGWGFDVRTRYRAQDRSGVEHEIDILGTKKEQFGDLTLAVECKNHMEPIDIKEIRNFRDKLGSLGYTKGLFVSTGGFTPPALQYATSVGIETWDNSKFQENLTQAKTNADTIPNALPVSQWFKSAIEPKLANATKLRLAELNLTYTPYYFLNYHSFTQDRVNFELTNLESKGLVVISGVSGEVADSIVHGGVAPNMVRCGTFATSKPAEARDASRQNVGSGFTKVVVERAVVSESEARRTAQLELAKSIAQSYAYQGKLGYKVTSERKTLRPKIGDVNILSASRVYVPVIDATYAIGRSRYHRRVQGSSLGVMSEDFGKCSITPVHDSPPTAACEECGALLCRKHLRQCKVCEKYLCKADAVEKGFYSKFYCKSHAP